MNAEGASMDVPVIEAREDEGFQPDAKGFFVIYINKEEKHIVVEHYSNMFREKGKLITGKLEFVITGRSAKAIGDTLNREKLLSRIDHAIYLGRELQKAELALKYGLEYIQDAEIKLPLHY